MDEAQKKLRDEFVKEIRQNSVYKRTRTLLLTVESITDFLWFLNIVGSMIIMLVSFSYCSASSEYGNPMSKGMGWGMFLSVVVSLIIGSLARFLVKAALEVAAAMIDIADMMWDQNVRF